MVGINTVQDQLPPRSIPFYLLRNFWERGFVEWLVIIRTDAH